MTDDLVQRIRAEADMASRAGQAAALHKISDDLAARNVGAEVDREALVERVTDWLAESPAASHGVDSTDEGYSHLSALTDDEWRALAEHLVDRILAARGDAAAPTVPVPLTVKFDGGRRAVLDQTQRIVGYLVGAAFAPPVTAGQRNAAVQTLLTAHANPPGPGYAPTAWAMDAVDAAFRAAAIEVTP